MAGLSYPSTVKERAKLYLHCMVEIKQRLAIAQSTLESELGPLFINEVCSLQYRHICELIAIACLAAQGDFKTQKAFRQEYSPAKIFNALRDLYPDFFPQASQVSYVSGQHHLQANAKPDAYREADVVQLWNKAGNDLHRASVDKYLRNSFKPPKPTDLAKKHLRGLIMLLESHVIPVQSSTDNVLLDVRLEDGEGNVTANFLTINLDTNTIAVESYKSKLISR